MIGVISFGSIVIGSVLLERRFQTEGNLGAANMTKSFIKFFLIGAGCFVVYSWIGAAAHFVILH